MLVFREVVATILFSALPAMSQPIVTVTVYHSSVWPCDGQIEAVYLLAPGEDAVINLSTCADRVNIVTTPVTTVDIGRLVFTGGPSTFPVDIVLGEGEIIQSDNRGTPVGRDWEGMDASLLNETRFAGGINGSLIGPIEVHHMYRFDVLGEVRSAIEVESPFPGGILVLEAGTITPTGWIRVDSGSILRARAAEELDGSVIAAHGAITEGVFAGTIGSPGSPVTITAGYGNLAQVKAQAIYANITAVEGPQFSGYLGRLEATAGQFVGSILAHELRNNNEVSRFSCVGDMDADIATDGGNLADLLIISSGDFPAGRTLSVNSLAPYDGRVEIREVSGTSTGGHLYGDMLFAGAVGDPDRDFILDNGLCGLLRIGYNLIGDIRIYGTPGQPNEGLTGQVIVNGLNWPENHPNGWDDWTGSVSIGPDPSPTVLAPIPYYDNPSASIGGGAVAKVPYYLRYQDCDPVGVKFQEDMATGLDGLDECEDGYHAIVLLNPNDPPPPSVTLRHYGPIEQHGLGRPYTVKRKSLGAIGCVWTNISSQFTHTLPPGDPRDIVISGLFEAGYDYLIEPRPHGIAEEAYLYCGGLDPAVGEVGLYAYDYRLRVATRQDITVNGALAPDDISAWLANPVDTTLDGVADGADLVDVTEAVAESGDW